MLHWLNANVVSDKEKAMQNCQVRNSEMNANEPLMNRRKLFDDVKTKFCLVAWEKSSGNLFTS